MHLCPLERMQLLDLININLSETLTLSSRTSPTSSSNKDLWWCHSSVVPVTLCAQTTTIDVVSQFSLEHNYDLIFVSYPLSVYCGYSVYWFVSHSVIQQWILESLTFGRMNGHFQFVFQFFCSSLVIWQYIWQINISMSIHEGKNIPVTHVSIRLLRKRV